MSSDDLIYDPVSSVMRTSEDGSDPKNEPLLSEEQTEGNVGVTVKRKYRDFFAAVAFLTCFGLMTILAIIFHFSNKQRTDPIPGSLRGFILKAISDSIVPIIIVGISAAIIGLIWAYLLRQVVKTTVWFTVYSIPVSLLIASIWCFSTAVSDAETRISSAIMGVVFIGLAVGAAFFLKYYMNKKIEITIKLMELACDVLKDHPSIFGVSALATIAYIFFSLLFLWNFSRTFMLGFIKNQDGFEPIWILNPESYVLMSFFIFVFLWVSAVVSNIQTYILASITCTWYFHRNDFVMMRHNVVTKAFKEALTTSFGSICLGSLLVASANFLQLIANHLAKRKLHSRVLQKIISWTVHLIYKMTEIINRHAIAYCALTGDGFIDSTKQVVAILRRNNFDRITIDVFARFALWLWCFSLSTLFSLIINTYGIRQLGTIHGWATSSLAFAVCYFVLSFFSEILLKVIDALFVCYFVDVDRKTNEVIEENINVYNTFKRIITPGEQVVEVVEEEVKS